MNRKKSRSDIRKMKLARWQKPLVGGHRARAWLNTLFVDHAFIRVFHLNEHRVDDDMRRSGQPMPHHIKRWADDGVKTIINLRGGRDFGSYPLAQEAVTRYGLVLEELTLRSRELPSKELIHEAARLFERIEYPAALHCKAGADRAGFGAFLYLILHKKLPIEQAQRQLSWRYGHIRSSKTGILDAFIDAYAASYQQTGVDFLTWVDTIYDPVEVQQGFHASFWGRLFGDYMLRRE